MPIIPVTEFSTFIDRFIRRGQSGAADAIFPRFMEEQGIFTFPVFPDGLHWRFGSMTVESFAGAAGVTVVNDTEVVGTAFRYYHAVSASHDDPITRVVSFEVRDTVTGAVCGIGSEGSASQGRHSSLTRPIVIGERHQLRAVLNSLAAPNILTLRTYSVQIGLGAPLPVL